MSTLLRQPVSVKPSLVHGLGVFADVDIAAGETIEECYVLAIPKTGVLQDYVFGIKHDDFKDLAAIPLGYGAIYNHSFTPNAEHQLSIEKSLLHIRANQPIKRGDEIFICYGENWFSSRDIDVKQVSLKYKMRMLLRRTRRLRRMLLVAIAFVLFMNLI